MKLPQKRDKIHHIFFREKSKTHIAILFSVVNGTNFCTALNIYISITFEPFYFVFHTIYSKYSWFFGEHIVWSIPIASSQCECADKVARRLFTYLANFGTVEKKKRNCAKNRSEKEMCCTRLMPECWCWQCIHWQMPRHELVQSIKQIREFERIKFLLCVDIRVV